MIALALAVTGVLVTLLAFFNRRAAIYLILPAIALSPEVHAGGLAVRIEDLLMVPLAAGWIIHLCVFKDRRRTPLDRLLIAYVLAALAGSVWGTYLGTAHVLTLDKYVSAPFHLLKRIEFVLLFFIVADTLRSVDDIRRYAYMMVASLLALSGFSLVAFLGNRAIALAPAGAPVHEPGLASVLTVALAVSLIPVARPPARALLGALILFSLVVLPLSLGRNFIATAVVLLLYVGITQQRWIFLALPVPWLIGLLFYPEQVVRRVLTFQHALAPDITGSVSQGASLLSRVQSPLRYAVIALGHSPLFGFGLGSVPLGFMDSEYTTQLTYTGLVGFAVFLLVGIRVFEMARRAIAAAPDPFSAALARGLRFVLAAYALYSLFSPSISAARAGGLFFVAIALLAALHWAVVREAAPERLARPDRARGAAAPRPGRLREAGARAWSAPRAGGLRTPAELR